MEWRTRHIQRATIDWFDPMDLLDSSNMTSNFLTQETHLKKVFQQWTGRFLLGMMGLTLCLSSMDLNASEVQTQIGKKAPKWELPCMDGKTVVSEKYAGKIVVFNFWATWCPPCRAEIPDFMKIHDAYKDKNVVVIGISLDSSLGPVKRFIRTQKLNYPVLMGDAKLVAAFGNFSAIPQTFIIDDEGRIHTQFQGLVKQEALEKKLNTLLGDGAKE